MLILFALVFGFVVPVSCLLILGRAPDGAHVREKMNLSSHGDRYREALGHFDDVLQGTIKKWISYPEGVYICTNNLDRRSDADAGAVFSCEEVEASSEVM